MRLIKTWLVVAVVVLAGSACDAIADDPGNDTDIALR